MNSILEKWHTFVKSPNPAILQEILADDVTFHSPVVHTPQQGKMITMMYLLAAVQTFDTKEDNFKYVREVINDQHIILEFEVEVDGIFINGIDMIEVNPEGKIQDFKVMVRPLKAMQKLHQKMAAMLQKMKSK